MMPHKTTNTKESYENLIAEWKKLRLQYFNIYNENMEKFEKRYGTHRFYDSVVKYLDKSFRDVNQIADQEVKKYLTYK
jgi:hypothetical protein